MLSKGTYNMYFHSQRAHKNTAVKKKNYPKTMQLSAFQSGRIQSCSENSLWSVSAECGCRRRPSDSHGCFLAREGNVRNGDRSRASLEAVTCTHGKEKDSAKQNQQTKNAPSHAIDGKPSRRRFHVSRRQQCISGFL